MINIKNKRAAKRHRLHLGIRKRIQGTPSRPRLCLYKSNTTIYAQLIDDTKGHTLVAANSAPFKGKSCIHAKKTAEVLAQKALEKDIKNVVFDRSGYLYHGVVKAFSEAARQQGLQH
jgi:large subunit ribosomal protein L18